MLQCLDFSSSNRSVCYLHLLQEISVLCLCVLWFHTSPLSPSVRRKAASYCGMGPSTTNAAAGSLNGRAVLPLTYATGPHSSGLRSGLCWPAMSQWHHQRPNRASAWCALPSIQGEARWPAQFGMLTAAGRQLLATSTPTPAAALV